MITPPAADLRDRPEPAIPDAAFETEIVDGTVRRTEGARAAEAAWNDDILLWGRDLRDALGRACRAVKAQAPAFPDVCQASPETNEPDAKDD